MNEGEYQRLLKILTVRACRVLRVATSKGDDWTLGESGKSPADFAAETLIRWGTNQLQFTTGEEPNKERGKKLADRPPSFR